MMADISQGALHVFHKYMGAVFISNGMATVQEWISQLLEPGCQTPIIPAAAASNRHSQPSGFNNFQPAPPPPPPPTQPPPPPPPAYYPGAHVPAQPPPPPGSASVTFQILAQFNMTAHQRGYTVTYPARSEGPHHTPVWHVQCCLNGEVRGEGSGKNQKQAKEMAARQAWTSMGWGHIPDQ
ncbi:hypothetical protein AN958_06681 [Leucoagaricus sp. SymC.cos]|nr:hypothetical protein AN958_06681 [Leucoagaricus sp. SymC.cos]